MKIRVRFIGDKKAPQGENIESYLKEEAKQSGDTIDFRDVIHPSAGSALAKAKKLIAGGDESWQLFEALVLDLRYLPPGGDFDGLEVVWDGLIKERRLVNDIRDERVVAGRPLNWENVYVSTIWLDSRAGQIEVAKKMRERHLPVENVFAAATRKSYVPLAKKIIADARIVYAQRHAAQP